MKWILCAGLLALTACADLPFDFSRSATFSKPGATRAERSADLRTCRTQARSATDLDYKIDHDIRAARSISPLDSADAFLHGQREQRTSQRHDDIVKRCMRRRGYG